MLAFLAFFAALYGAQGHEFGSTPDGHEIGGCTQGWEVHNCKDGVTW